MELVVKSIKNGGNFLICDAGIPMEPIDLVKLPPEAFVDPHLALIEVSDIHGSALLAVVFG